MNRDDKVLFVDDEENVLSALRRQLRNHLVVLTAPTGVDGLNLLRDNPDIKVVVSDMRMPKMDGVDFLAQAVVVLPDAIRMVLSGHSDLGSAVEAVNKGHIFRFLLKPCLPDVLLDAISAGIEQYRLVRAERELLDRTLSGVVEVLCEVMGLVEPLAYGRGSRIRGLARHLAEQLGMPNPWQFELAAQLASLGYVTLPHELIQRVTTGKTLTAEDHLLLSRQAEVSARLVRHIPRLEPVAEMILHQGRHFLIDQPIAGLTDRELADLGGHAIGVLLEFDRRVQLGDSPQRVIADLSQQVELWDPTVVAQLSALVLSGSMSTRAVMLNELEEGMVLLQDVYSGKAALVVPRGHRVSALTVQRLQTFAQHNPISEPILVQVSDYRPEVHEWR